MSAAPAIRPISPDLDRARQAERIEAELEHVGNWLDDWAWFDRCGVSIADLVGFEARAIHEARALLGEACRSDDGRCDLRALSREIERRDDLLGGMDLSEIQTGLQSVSRRLALIQLARGGIGREPQLARAIRTRRVDDEIAAAHRRGAAGADVLDELARLRAERDHIDAGSREDRFSDAATRAVYVFESAPKPREMLFRDFMPAAESGLLSARGGTGKGHLQILLAQCLALGADFANYPAARPRGVLLVSAEDDREELHRRIHAALLARFGTDGESLAAAKNAFEKRVRIIDLRGATGIGLGPPLRERILRVIDRLDDPGLALIDPIGRFLPAGAPPGFLNSQEGAATIIGEFDAIRTASGCTVLGAHHVAKSAIQMGSELDATAATGSQQLVDFSRWTLALKPLTNEEAGSYGLRDGRFVEAAVPKSNYTPGLGGALVFRRAPGGALVHVDVRPKSDETDEKMLATLIGSAMWLTREQWNKRAAEFHSTSKHDANNARTRLLAAGSVAQHEVREGRRCKLVFAPASHIRMDRWPNPPTIAELGEDGDQ